MLPRSMAMNAAPSCATLPTRECSASPRSVTPWHDLGRRSTRHLPSQRTGMPATKRLCITPNPALDRTLTVRGFTLGGVSRTGDVLLAAGGKGLNVARAARTLGAEAVCLGILAGHTGR